MFVHIGVERGCYGQIFLEGFVRHRELIGTEMVFHKMGGESSTGKGRVSHYEATEPDRSGHARDAILVQCADHAGNGLLA